MKHKIIILLLLIILLIITIKKSEHFKYDDVKNSKSGVQTTPDILLDPLFKNMKFYLNDENPYEGGKLGLDKCFEECNGSCVEFGVSGNTFCFPPLSEDI